MEGMKREAKKFTVEIKQQWCKSCGICYALCPKGVLSKDQLGKAIVKDPAACIGCRICEEHCPDYCIKIRGEEM